MRTATNRSPRQADWQSCYDAGMTAPEAAAHLGRCDSSAYGWASRRGLRWPNAQPGFPVSVRGKVYPSMAAAAKALGVTPHTLSDHLARHGNLDRAGIGKAGNGRNNATRKPITIAGVTYPTRKAAAAALGLSYGNLFKSIRAGRYDLILSRALKQGMARDAAALKAREAEQHVSDLSHGIRELRYDSARAAA